MSYIEALQKALKKYETIETEFEYWDFVADSHVGELFHTIELSYALYQHHDNWQTPGACVQFLDRFSNWTGVIVASKQNYDPDSNNLSKLFRFGETIRIYLALLRNTKLTKRMLFQYCIALSLQFNYETIDNPKVHQAASSFFTPSFSRKNIKFAWKCIQHFLSVYHSRVKELGARKYFSHTNPRQYFQLFIQSKDIAFPVVFIRRDARETTMQGSLEECRIWLDIQLEHNNQLRRKVNLVALHNPTEQTPYEDRIIGETIEKAVLEAVDCYNGRCSPRVRKQTVRSIFFKIGRYDQNYDGASIGSAAFFAALTRLAGRHLPDEVFYTGKLGCQSNTIEGVSSKAVVGWDSGFRTFIVPQENLEELTEELEKTNLAYDVFQDGRPLSGGDGRLIRTYQSIDDLYNIWEDLTSTQKSFSESVAKDIHNLSLKNKHFTGRRKYFDFLGKKFDSGIPIVALCGLGGVGKTEIAIEYAHRFREYYSLIWRVRGEELSTVVIDFARLAQKLDLPQKDTREEEVILDAVREWLENHTGWLLIFDNVENPQILFNDDLPVLPRGGSGHVLITSRFQDWEEWCERIVVNKFLAEESIQFLIKRTGKQNRKTAAVLAKKVGHLPLALAQAAAYARKQEISLEEYLVLFDNERKKLWKEEDAPRNYPYTVATTWKIAMARIRREFPLAVDLLNLVSVQAPDDIPIELLLADQARSSGRRSVKAANRLASLPVEPGTLRKLKNHIRHRLLQGKRNQTVTLVGNKQTPFVYRKAITALKSYSLVEGNFDSLSVHSLVQMVTRVNLGPEKLKLWIETALELMDDIFPRKSGDSKNWPLCSRLYPHAVAVSAASKKANVLPQKNLSLLEKLGEYLGDSAQYIKAEDVQRKALEIAEDGASGPNVELSRVSNALGTTLEARDHYDAAFELFEKALEIDRTIHSARDPQIARDLNHLGNISLKQGKLDDALNYFKSALECNYDAYNDRHPSIAAGRNNLGRTFAAKGNFSLAQKHFDKALENAGEFYGRSHPFVAEIINNLGDIYLLRGNLKRAKEDYELAFDIDRAFFGMEHPRVAEDLNRIGTVLIRRRELPKAEKLFRQALETNRKIFGNQHHSIARDYNSLGQLEKAKGNALIATSHFRKALMIAKSVYKTFRHPFIADIANNYGYAILEQKNFDEARKYIELALDINRKSYRSNHPLIACGLNNLARIYHLERKMDQAQKNYFVAYEILANLLPKNHPDLMEVRKNLLELADDYNREDTAENKHSERLFCPKSAYIHKRLKISP